MAVKIDKKYFSENNHLQPDMLLLDINMSGRPKGKRCPEFLRQSIW